MNLCMTELRGLGSNLFSNLQGMVTTELVKRTNPDFVAASAPQKRQATNLVQHSKSAPESRTVAPTSPSVVVTNPNSSLSQLQRTLSDPKRLQDKQKQKQTMNQVCIFFKFTFVFYVVNSFLRRLSANARHVSMQWLTAFTSTTYRLFQSFLR